MATPSTDTTSSDGSDALRSARAVRGSTLLAVLVAILILVFVINLAAALHNRSSARNKERDIELIADPGRVRQEFATTADGMTLTRVVVADGLAASELDRRVGVVRRISEAQRLAHLGGDYGAQASAVPEAAEVRGEVKLPGRSDLEFGSMNGLLNVRVRDIPGGAELHWITTDQVMTDSLAEWSVAVTAATGAAGAAGASGDREPTVTSGASGATGPDSPGSPGASGASGSSGAPDVATVDITMGAISFAPSVVTVLAGATVRFRFTNTSNVDHEALLGDGEVQAARERVVERLVREGRDTAGSDGVPGGDYVFVPAGETRTLEHTFGDPGRTTIGCHQPGMWASGMRIAVIVDSGRNIG